MGEFFRGPIRAFLIGDAASDEERVTSSTELPFPLVEEGHMSPEDLEEAVNFTSILSYEETIWSK